MKARKVVAFCYHNVPIKGYSIWDPEGGGMEKNMGGGGVREKICEGVSEIFHSAPLRISNGIALRWS